MFVFIIWPIVFPLVSVCGFCVLSARMGRDGKFASLIFTVKGLALLVVVAPTLGNMLLQHYAMNFFGHPFAVLLNQFLSPKIRVQPIINKSCCVLQCNFPIFASCCFAVFINYLKCKTFKNSEIKFINIAAVEQKTSKHFYIFTIIELGAEFSLCLTHFTQ